MLEREFASLDGFARAWLAYDGDVVVGTAMLTVVSTLHRLGEPLPIDRVPVDARVRNVYVRPEYRRRGIGLLLMKELLREAERAGVDRLTLGASDMGRPLYETLGFAPKTDEMVYRGEGLIPRETR